MPSGPERPSRVTRNPERLRCEARALGERVWAFRRAAGWTLEETAERAGLDWKHLQKLEAGSLNFTFGTLVRLADGFQKPLYEFFRPLESAPAEPHQRLPGRPRTRAEGADKPRIRGPRTKGKRS